MALVESARLDAFQLLRELGAFEVCVLAENRHTYLGHAVWNDDVLFLTCIPYQRTVLYDVFSLLFLYVLRLDASSGDGALSLLSALNQHTDKKEMDQQLKEADEVDGGKIIGHIFGKKQPEVTQNLSAQSGLTQEQVNQILGIMAPAIMSGVSEAKEEAEAAQKPASSQHAFGATPGIFSALLGTAANTQKEEIQEENEAINGAALLQALLNARR